MRDVGGEDLRQRHPRRARGLGALPHAHGRGVRRVADGALVGAPAVEGFDPNPLFAATARSAQAALVDCAPYDFLPRDQYDLWKDNTLDFNPNMMFAS